MIYTCYEMIRDCRSNRPEGWRYFIANYVPVMRKLLQRYAGGEDLLDRMLVAVGKPESSMFQSMEPAPERWFVAELRQRVLAELASPADAATLDLDTVAAALEPLTLLEKQAAWLETMRYDAAETGPMLRMSPPTVEKIRDRARDLLRGKVDTWSRDALVVNGAALGRSAAAVSTPDCLSAKVFLDVLDGRATWRGREQMERHAAGCWHCVDYFCRLVEVVDLLRGMQPLTGEQAAPFLPLLGVSEKKPRLWRRFL
jgi:hypothetical protein